MTTMTTKNVYTGEARDIYCGRYSYTPGAVPNVVTMHDVDGEPAGAVTTERAARRALREQYDRRAGLLPITAAPAEIVRELCDA